MVLHNVQTERKSKREREVAFSRNGNIVQKQGLSIDKFVAPIPTEP